VKASIGRQVTVEAFPRSFADVAQSPDIVVLQVPQFQPAREKIIGNAEAASRMTYTYRQPWGRPNAF
jgi:hypothetical protein